MNGCCEICYKKLHYSKSGEKENWKNIGKNKQEKTGYQSHNTTSYHQHAYKNPYPNLQMHRNLLQKKCIIQSKERKKIGQIQGIKRGEVWFSIPQYRKSSLTCIPNMTNLACMVVEKSLMKKFIIQSMERKNIGQIQGRISRKRLVLNPTIQHIVINLHTK